MSNELIQIDTVEDLENYLINIHDKAEITNRDILTAQLQVVKNVKSPELVGTTFDTLFKSIKSALKKSQTESERNEIREKGSVIIQNYVFFNRAKLAYIIEKNNKEAEKLYSEAGEMLAKSVVNIAIDSAPKGFNQVVVAKSIFTQVLGNKNLIIKIFKFWFKKDDQEEREKEFFQGLHLLFEKLRKQKKLIGESDIISGMIDNYKQKLVEHLVSDLSESYNNYYNRAESCISKLKIYSLIILGFSFVLLVIKFFWYQLSSFSDSIVSLFSEETTEVANNPWFLRHLIWTLAILAVVAIFQYVLYFKNKKIATDFLNSYDSRKNDLLNYYDDLSISFQEGY